MNVFRCGASTGNLRAITPAFISLKHFALPLQKSSLAAHQLSHIFLYNASSAYSRTFAGIANMATSSKIVIAPALTGEFSVTGLTEASAKKASEVLQKNHEDHHIFFNKSGFHSRWPFFNGVLELGKGGWWGRYFMYIWVPETDEHSRCIGFHTKS